MERRPAMRFLLIGGIGYVGGRLATHLKRQGHYVRVTTRRPPSHVPYWMKADDVVEADPLKPESWRSALDSIDTVIDLAAPDENLAAKDPNTALEAGRDGTRNIMQALLGAARMPAFIYVSTFHVYGKNASGAVTEKTPTAPQHPYAIAKLAAENIVQDFRSSKKVSALCVRLSNTFGAPAGNALMRETLVFNDLCRQAAEHKKLLLKTTGTQKRNFIPMSDAIEALLFLSERRAQWPQDGILHIGSDDQWSIREAADKVAHAAEALWGIHPPVIVPPEAPAEGGHEFQFNVDRLRKLGFKGANHWEQEIKATLTVCKDAAQSHA